MCPHEEVCNIFGLGLEQRVCLLGLLPDEARLLHATARGRNFNEGPVKAILHDKIVSAKVFQSLIR